MRQFQCLCLEKIFNFKILNDFLQSVRHECNPVIVLIQYFVIGLLDYDKNNNQYSSQ